MATTVDPQSRVQITRRGVRVAERLDISVEFHGEDKQRFLADPAGYMKSVLEAEGHRVRDFQIDAADLDGQTTGSGPIQYIWARYHIVWDEDPSVICWYTP